MAHDHTHERHSAHHQAHQHAHTSGCGCAGHKALRKPPAANGNLWSALLPILACAICPACLTTYAKLLAVAGVGFGLSETAHVFLLALALAASLVVSGYRSWRSRRIWPIAFATTGASFITAAHLLGEVRALEWLGVLVLLAGGLAEHFRLRAAALLAAEDETRANA